MFIDTHCHLDAAEFAPDRRAMRERARAAGVHLCVWPAVQAQDFERLGAQARAHGDAYALGIHPLYSAQASLADVTALANAVQAQSADPHLVAVGEIGLDAFVPQLRNGDAWEHQVALYRAQLKVAKRAGLPVILHVRRSADALLKGLREIGAHGGIAHAFNGSLQQAQAFLDLGFKLGFGGALTFERALQLRRLATELPLEALVLETDAPDIPPAWCYQTAQARAAGHAQGRNEPAELPRIAAVLAQLRGISLEAVAESSCRQACDALPRLKSLL